MKGLNTLSGGISLQIALQEDVLNKPDSCPCNTHRYVLQLTISALDCSAWFLAGGISKRKAVLCRQRPRIRLNLFMQSHPTSIKQDSKIR
jgi:hypothetical protein